MSGRRESRRGSRSGQHTGSGGWWQHHRAWVAGLSRKQRIRYRLFQGLVVLSIVILMMAAALRLWMRVPDVPQPPGMDASQGGDGTDFGGELPDVAKSGRRKGVYTFLVVGQDTAGGGNTDTMILVTFDSQGKTIHGLSLPRDTMVNVSTRSKRLNAVYNYNKGKDKNTQLEKGIGALKTEVGKLTGIYPDFYVVVQWEAVGELVDALGGVDFDVPFDMDYEDPTPGQELSIHLKAGPQRLSGEDAMGLIRWRHNNDYSVQYPNGDLGRIQTQQKFLEAVAAECLKPATFLKLPSLAKIFMENVSTDLSIGNLLAFAQLASGMDASQDITFATLPNKDARYPGISMVLPIVDELVELLNQGFNPYLAPITSKDLQVLYRNSDGSYSVTSGSLQDPSLGRPRGGESTRPSRPSVDRDDEVEPMEPDEKPDGSQTPPDGSQTPPDGSQTPPDGSQTPPDGSQTPPDGSQTPPDSSQTPPDGSQTPPDGSQTPPDGSQTPPDGSQTPPDGSQTPPDGSQTPPDGSQTPPSGSQTPTDSSQTPPSGSSSGPSDTQSLPEPQNSGRGSTLTELPDWINPSGSELAA